MLPEPAVLGDVTELLPSSSGALRPFSACPWHSPFAYPFGYLDKVHLDPLSTQLVLFGWLLSQGQLGNNLKVGMSEAATWPWLVGSVVLWFPSSFGKRHPRCLAMSHGGCWWAPAGHGFGREIALGTSSRWNCKVLFVIILYLVYSIAGSCSSVQIVGIQGETASLDCFPLPTVFKSTNQHLFKIQIKKKRKEKTTNT